MTVRVSLKLYMAALKWSLVIFFQLSTHLDTLPALKCTFSFKALLLTTEKWIKLFNSQTDLGVQ